MWPAALFININIRNVGSYNLYSTLHIRNHKEVKSARDPIVGHILNNKDRPTLALELRHHSEKKCYVLLRLFLGRVRLSATQQGNKEYTFLLHGGGRGGYQNTQINYKKEENEKVKLTCSYPDTHEIESVPSSADLLIFLFNWLISSDPRSNRS